jgi:Na+/melibiose symporter-like transporter
MNPDDFVEQFADPELISGDPGKIPLTPRRQGLSVRQRMTLLTIGAVVIAAAAIWHFWKTLFGPGTWGSGGNLVAWVICGGLAFGWTWLLQHERHVQALVQAAQHHKDQMGQAAEHHKALMAHVTATVRPAVITPPPKERM